VEALLLACTHYPAIADPIRKILPVPLLDPAAKVAGRLAAMLPAGSENGSDLFFTTGSVDGSNEAARRAFGFRGAFGRVSI
jgi:glutamate racemase